MAEANVVATYAVQGATTQAIQLDTTDMDPDLIACYLDEDVPVDVSQCHEWAGRVSDAVVVGLIVFAVDGAKYRRDEETGHWVLDESGTEGADGVSADE